MAAEYAEHFVARRPQSRLGLVVAGTGSDALTVAGWDGPLNYDNDTAKFSTVVRAGACQESDRSALDQRGVGLLLRGEDQDEV